MVVSNFFGMYPMIVWISWTRCLLVGSIFLIKSYKSLYMKNGPIKTYKVLYFCPFSIVNLYSSNEENSYKHALKVISRKAIDDALFLHRIWLSTIDNVTSFLGLLSPQFVCLFILQLVGTLSLFYGSATEQCILSATVGVSNFTWRLMVKL